MTKENYAVADYGDFEIHVKQTGAGNRAFINALQKIEQKYSRKEKMADKGIISGEAASKLLNDKMQDLAGVYSEFVITGWKGKVSGKELPKFTKEAAIEIFGNKENDLLFADIIQFALDEANFQKELDDEEIKNS